MSGGPPGSPGRTRFIEHGGQRIVLLDFSGLQETEHGLAAVAEARAFIGALVPDGSHFTLTDTTGTRYDRKTIEAVKAMTVHNRPYVRAAAVVSDSSLHRAAISMIALFSKRRLEVFDTRERALAWLATQR